MPTLTKNTAYLEQYKLFHMKQIEREEIKMTDWKLNNFITSIIKEEMDIDGTLYLDTDRTEVEIDGDTVIYYVPIEYGHELADVKLVIYPDFTYRIELY